MNELDIFSAALEIDSPQERARYLDQACNNDRVLRAKIETLLRSSGKAASFLESPPAGLAPTLDAEIAEQPGTLIGPYKLLQQIGEGGFGVVYMAEQTAPVQRKVALKIIKPGMDTRQVVARFEAERQALALMDHSNIARVFDGGTTASGLPYFVMELVKGIPLTDYCDENKVPVQSRLELFATVCRAIQHAHHKGVIHRDIKPSNVMVTLHDGEPVPKVIDFGVSKAIGQRLTERTMFTAYGQMIGTPAYMSPEQAEMSGLDTDTRSDIYSLGVLLYELLTGTTPLESERLRSAGFTEMQRMIREEEPPRPSTRLSTLGGEATVKAASRGTDVKHLSQFVRGDLDWIVMKALEKDRNRRYDTPKAFADDLERFLRQEPIHARPPSAMYRLQKFVRRNKVRVSIAGTIAVAALISGYAINVAVQGRQREGQLVQEVQAKASEVQKGQAEAGRRKWAREVAIPQILAWMEAEQVVSAFKLAREVQEVLPDDPVFLDLWQKLAGSTSVTSNPPGARVSIRDWNAVDDQWLSIGMTPIERIDLPAGPMRWKFEKEGFVTRESQIKRLPEAMGTTLTDAAKHPGMLGIASRTFQDEDGERTLSPFLIDKHEVTNRDYQKFVDAGGYHNSDYWRDQFTDEHGAPIEREAAMRQFLDATGQPGPKLWRDGRYPPGQDDYPVRGVSWYEAMAFARFAGKGLPTQSHWRWCSYGEYKYMRPLSNMNSLGPDPVKHNQGIGIFGLYDMLGNVKEWCFNKHGDHRRCLLGADWKSPSYMAGTIDSAPPMARRENYGFRCARYRAEGNEWAFRPHVPRDFVFSPPATAQEIEQYLRLYEYDRGQPLNPKLVMADRNPSDAELRHEIVQIDAAYGEERFDIHLLIPRRGRAPFQAILWFPGTSSLQKQIQEERRQTLEFAYERALAKTGRIVCSPVYQGMYERNLRSLEGTVRVREWRIQMTKDLFRAVDYLQTRDDIDTKTLVYSGLSMGSALAPCHLVAEPRLKLALLFAGGAKGDHKSPEVDPMRFAPQVKIPLVMLNGQFDGIFHYEQHQLPFFDRLGSADKHLELYPTNHLPPIRESVGFADQWIRERTERPD